MSLRSKVREHRLIKFPISKLEEELLAIKSYRGEEICSYESN